jgi:hypothetical protein
MSYEEGFHTGRSLFAELSEAYFFSFLPKLQGKPQGRELKDNACWIAKQSIDKDLA